MPLSRPVLLALVGAILAVATFLATSAARQEAAAPAATPAVEQPKPPVKKIVADKPAVKAAPKKAEAKTPAKAAKPATPAKPAAPKVKGVPPAVASALAKKRVVILFFRQSGSADDSAVAGAVNSLKGRKGVSVFSDSIARLARYRAAVGQLGISQAPTVVIVGSNGQGQVVEGFVDKGTLTQLVVDAK